MNEFIQAVTKDYMNFQTRTRRKDYWMFVLLSSIPLFILFTLGMLFSGNPENPSPLSLVFFGLFGLLDLALIIPNYAILARRLHDTGRSGWMQLLIFVPLVGGIILLVLLVQDSQPGSNKWGPNPKGVTAQGAPAASANNW